MVEGDLKGSGSFMDFGEKVECEEGEAKSGKVLVLSKSRKMVSMVSLFSPKRNTWAEVLKKDLWAEKKRRNEKKRKENKGKEKKKTSAQSLK